MRFLTRLQRLPAQLLGESPFRGTLPIERLSNLSTLLAVTRYFRTPLRILDYVFQNEGDIKYLNVPGFPSILFIRDPELIRQVTVATANQGDFDRDTLPTQGIARVVGERNLLFAQGEFWKRHRTAVAKAFGASNFQDPEIYSDIEQTIRKAVEPQLEALVEKVRRSPTGTVRMKLEPSIQAMMLHVLVNVLFGSPIPHDELRDRYLPAIANVIRYILVDTITNQLRLPTFRLPTLTPRHKKLKKDRQTFEELVERVVQSRKEGSGFWPMLTTEVPEEAVRSNVRVILAGALEATSSYLGWALSNLARSPHVQEKAHTEAVTTEITPEGRERATYLQQVLSETLRLNASLYFLPRVARRDTKIETPHGHLFIPADTHLVLATYHAGRCERHWGESITGYPASEFEPERWSPANMASHGRSTKDSLHFGFGHGPRVCIGKHFSEVEAFVCLTLFLRRFKFRAVNEKSEADAGVSTRPRDGVDLELSLRF